ncbi:hypothetical protein ABZ761_33960, partial [Kitasatospora sp. NPDC006786]|uniref:hypothetical protein n=1 Tax=Kitasatospora sp. NPDC006786 TaxID=3157187 RepID=UPI0033D3C963
MSYTYSVLPAPGAVKGCRGDAGSRRGTRRGQDGDEVEPVEIGSKDGLDILRHSTAHVMAQAV